MSKYTNHRKINWDSPDLEGIIDWDNIDFLFCDYTDKSVEIRRHKGIPNLGGLTPIMAYAKNLKRMILSFKGGKTVMETIDDRLLFDMGVTLARGGSIPFAMK